MGKHWTKQEDTFLTENYTSFSNKQLAKQLNRSLWSIETRLTKKLHLNRCLTKKWSIKEDILLLNNYNNIHCVEVAKLLNTSIRKVKERARKLNLTKKDVHGQRKRMHYCFYAIH